MVRKHVFLSLLLVSVVTAFTGWGITSIWNERIVYDKQRHEERQVQLVSSQLSGYMANTGDLLRSLAQEPALKAALAQEDANTRMSDILFGVANRHISYYQARWIDEKGIERVRLQRFGRSIQHVPAAKLQDKSNRYYFQDAIKVSAGSVYFSPIDLNVEYGEVERPFRPMIRAAIRVFDSTGKDRGIVIINDSLTPMFEWLEHSTAHNSLLMANRNGDWLKGFNPQDEWGFMFGNPKRIRDSSEAAWRAMEQQVSGTLVQPEGIWIWDVADIGERQWGDSDAMDYRHAPKLILVSFISSEEQAQLVSNESLYVWIGCISVGIVIWDLLLAFMYFRHRHANVALQLQESERLRDMSADLTHARAQAQNLVNGNVNGILIVDGNGLILMTNPALDELFGYHKGELLGQPMEILAPDNEMLFYPDPSTADIGQSGRRTMAKNKHIHGKHRDGHLIDVEISLSPVESDDGIRVSATVVDITDRLEKEKRLRHYASAFREAGEAMVITDAHWKVEHVNSMFTRLCGLSEEKVTGATPDIFLLERMEPGGLSLQQYVEDADHWGGEWQALTLSGALCPVRLSISSVRDIRGRRSHYVFSFADISEIRDAYVQLEHQAYHDALTGLPNRVMLQESIDAAISRAKRHREKFALLFIDLDNFKYINDGLGHRAGDQLLKQVADALKEELRGEDVVARLGGDEFVVLLEGIGQADAARAVLSKLTRRLSSAFVIENDSVRVTASIGICIYPDDGCDAATLLRKSDMAMYQAKESGKNRCFFFNEDTDSMSRDILKTEYQLHRAIQENELKLVYQPQVDTRTGQLQGVEALVRWQHPERGEISPEEFLPVAEKMGLMAELENWVVRTASQQAMDWNNSGVIYGKMAINLSGGFLKRPEFATDVMAMIEESGCTASNIELEITEGFILHGATQVIRQLHRLKENGYSLAMDDFGTGYSSLSYLRKLPIDKLKIDKQFIKDIVDDDGSQKIVSAVIAMAKSLGMTVTAEGVETRMQAEILRFKECDQLQGFLFERPMPAKELERLHPPTGTG